jgi:hypothetical protein
VLRKQPQSYQSDLTSVATSAPVLGHQVAQAPLPDLDWGDSRLDWSDILDFFYLSL